MSPAAVAQQLALELERIGAARLRGCEARLARATRAHADALRRHDALDDRRRAVQAEPLHAARTALRDADMASLRALAAQRAQSAQTVAALDAVLVGLQDVVVTTQRRRTDAAAAFTRQRARCESLERQVAAQRRAALAREAQRSDEDAVDTACWR